MGTETIKDILRKMRDGSIYDENGGVALHEVADRIDAAYKRETVTDCDGLNEDGDWLNQLVSLINGEVAHYMSQGSDYFSVDCGPWLIHYDNTGGEANNEQ